MTDYTGLLKRADGFCDGTQHRIDNGYSPVIAYGADNVIALVHEQAAAIRDLQAENAKLREALKPFADESAKYDLAKDDVFDTAWDSMFEVGAFFVARAALGDVT